jgi:UDP-N-acetyl-D-mannosaminuronic acid transferase (WecB/TagA/CpsF family)
MVKSGEVKFHVFNTDTYTVVGFEVTMQVGKLYGTPVKVRVAPVEFAKLLKSGSVITNVSVWLKGAKDGREFVTSAKRWWEFRTNAVRVSSLSGTPYFEEEGFSASRTEYSGRVFVAVSE